MTAKQLLIVGGIAASVFWLLMRSQDAQAGGVSITGTDGRDYQLSLNDGRVYDQNGGLWT